MTNKILKYETKDKTLITTVEFTFDDNSTKTVDISHFRPTTVEQVISGIENRGQSEWSDIQYPNVLENITKELDVLIS